MELLFYDEKQLKKYIDKHGQTFDHSYGKLNMLQLAIRKYPKSAKILANAVNIFYQGEYGYDAFDEAISQKNLDLLEFLFQICPYRSTYTWRSAVETNDPNVFQLCLDYKILFTSEVIHCCEQCNGSIQSNVLDVALKHNCVKIVEIIVNTKLCDLSNSLPKSLSCLRLMLDAKANVQTMANRWFKSHNSNPLILRALIENGAIFQGTCSLQKDYFQLCANSTYQRQLFKRIESKQGPENSIHGQIIQILQGRQIPIRAFDCCIQDCIEVQLLHFILDLPKVVKRIIASYWSNY